MQVSALTLLILHLNSLIDSGKYADISIEDAHKAMENSNVLGFLKQRCGSDIDLSIHSNSGPYINFEDLYEAEMVNYYNAYAGNEGRKMGVRNSGLSVILAWTNEIIQHGAFMSSGEKLEWRD